MKKHLLSIYVIISFLTINESFSQADLSHEVGINFGVGSFQTDFGQSNDFPSANASTLSFGVVHYLKFFGSQYNWRSGSSYFGDHFRVRTEFTFMNKTNIQHEPWIGEPTTSPNIAKLQAMRGNIKFMNIGSQLEYYFISIEDYSNIFSNQTSFNPYVSVGIHFSMFDPEVTSLLGDDAENFLIRGDVDKWVPGETIYQDPDNTFGVSFGAGLRYSMQYFDLVFDGRWQHFFSDEVDGLNAPDDPGNKYNDTLINVTLGIVYTFNRY